MSLADETILGHGVLIRGIEEARDRKNRFKEYCNSEHTILRFVYFEILGSARLLLSIPLCSSAVATYAPCLLPRPSVRALGIDSASLRSSFSQL